VLGGEALLAADPLTSDLDDALESALAPVSGEDA
jgi:hypothetical protein